MYAKSDRAVPTALAAPLLEKLSTEVCALTRVSTTPSPITTLHPRLDSVLLATTRSHRQPREPARTVLQVEQLEMVLESDASPQHDQFSTTWWMASLLSSEHRQLRDELDACRALSRRIMGVKFTAVEFAARGQAGVRPPSPEEEATNRRASTLSSSPSGRMPPGAR